jgi:hypothetical protein
MSCAKTGANHKAGKKWKQRDPPPRRSILETRSFHLNLSVVQRFSVSTSKQRATTVLGMHDFFWGMFGGGLPFQVRMCELWKIAEEFGNGYLAASPFK